MSERIFDVEITIRKMVRVRVPDEVLEGPPGGSAEDAAEEFALYPAGWREYIVSQNEDFDVDSVREITLDRSTT